jgi:ketosteroid isomerase-like protein
MAMIRQASFLLFHHCISLYGGVRMRIQEVQHVLNPERSNRDVERVYQEWDAALARNDGSALLQLYAPDAILESPLIPHLLRKREGVCRGHDEIKQLFDLLAERKPPVRQFYRTGFLTDGRKLVWEYPHETPDGEQMDFVEVMEVENGLIRRHRVYWGWFGFDVLQRDAYHR